MVEWRATLAGQQVENRITVDMLTAPTPTNIEALAIIAYNWARDHYTSVLPTTCTINSVVATDLSVHEGVQFTYSPATLPGGVALAALPNEVSFCLSLRSDSRGRSARGRFFWLAIVDTFRDTDNTLAAGTANGFVEILNILRTAITGAGFAWVVVSYRTLGAPRVGGPVFFPIVSIIFTDRVLDSMRRRKPGVGS
jgi:hypothetical protein